MLGELPGLGGPVVPSGRVATPGSVSICRPQAPVEFGLEHPREVGRGSGALGGAAGRESRGYSGAPPRLALGREA